ncbi:MAG TPA: hypothetical protein PLQ04_08895 [Lachnospiraceae bacterium]|nr:hypothetical protein [Lachnospiraceae bacterium]
MTQVNTTVNAVSQQVIYGTVFPEVVYDMGFIACEDDAEYMTQLQRIIIYNLRLITWG